MDGDRPLDVMKSIRFRSLCIQQISYLDFELYNYTADIQDSAMRHNFTIADHPDQDFEASYSRREEDLLALLSRFQANLTIDMHVSILCMVHDTLFRERVSMPG